MKISPRTRRNIRKVLKLLNEDRDLTNQQLADKMRMCVSSISRLKKLAVDYGYSDTEGVANLKYLQYLKPKSTGEQLILDLQPLTEPTVTPAPVTVDLTATPASVFSVPSNDGNVSSAHVAVATIMRKLSSVIAGNNHPDIWRDISAYAQLMLTQSKAVERVESLKDKA